MQKVIWTNEGKPIVNYQPSTVQALLYNLRCVDQVEGLLLDAVSVDDIVQDGSGQIYDALVVAFQRLPTAMKALSRVLNAAQSKLADGLTVAAMQISPPFTKNGSTNVVALFELSDGQTIAIYFHNPETTPKKIQLDDAVVSWKWLLNKLDITIAVAPERGRDLDVRKVAERVMALAVANSKKFQAANVKRAEKLAEITALKEKIASVDAELGKVLEEISALEIEHGEDAAWKNTAEPGEAVTEQTAETTTAQPESTATAKAKSPPPSPALPVLDVSAYAAVVAIKEPPMRTPFEWVQMNGDKPLQGSETQVLSRADLPGRYCAALDPQDELSSEYLPLNAKAGARVVFVASDEQVRAMALNTAPVYQLPSLLALTLEEQQIALEPYVSRLAGRSYAELVALAAMPIPEATPTHEANVAAEVQAEIAAGENEFTPTNPTGYAVVMGDPALQLAWQDKLDAFFTERIVNVRNALRNLGWSSRATSQTRLYKEDAEIQPEFTKVGPGNNVVGWSIKGIRDDLTKSAEQYAAEVDAAAMMAHKAQAESAAAQTNIARPLVSRASALKALDYLKPFMATAQRNTVKQLMQGEEKQFFYDKMLELADIIRNMPRTYQQQNEDQPTYYLHYFRGGADWYIAEKDKLGDGTLQAFGLADLYNDGGELGYINIGELVAAGIELDFHFEPRKLVSPDTPNTTANNTPSTQTEKQMDTKAMDAQFLRDVINVKIDLLENDTAERLEAVGYTYEKDAEMYPLWSDAVTTYTNFMIEKMKSVL